jgi:hypothetical protein
VNNGETAGNGASELTDADIDQAIDEMGAWSDAQPQLREVVYAFLRMKIAECDARIAEGAVTRSPVAQISMVSVVQAFGDHPPPDGHLVRMHGALDKVANLETYARMLERQGLVSAITTLAGETREDSMPWDRVATEVRDLVGVHLREEALTQQRLNVRSSLQTTIARNAFGEIAALSAEMGQVGYASGFDIGAYTASEAALMSQVVVMHALVNAAEYLEVLSEQAEDGE